MKKEYTTIAIFPETKKQLAEMAVSKTETWDELILRLMKDAKTKQ